MNPQAAAAAAADGAAFDRDAQWARLQAAAHAGRVWDLLVIGGGAVGLGVALDAAARGLQVVLAEARDFAEGTSSRSTKLVHGGVRYLAQGDIALVREALRERSALLANAPHLAQRLPFVMPGYQWWESGFYGVGLKAYDVLAGSRGLGATQWLSAARTRELLPGARTDGPLGRLQGGVRYWDGQFDDARLALALARTAAARGALLLNHCAALALHHQQGRVSGVRLRCAETGATLDVAARCVVNATGVWVDGVLALDAAAGPVAAAPSPAAAPLRASLVAPSQGVHLVVDRAFLPGNHALLVPKTADGRVLFAVPWLGKTVLGTTDTPRADVVLEPRPLKAEVDFILDEAGRYLARAPQRSDVRSVWVGLRPLLRPGWRPDGAQAAGAVPTQRLSREHTVLLAPSGLLTVTGGKWTTYRSMAEDVLAQAMQAGLLPQRDAGVTTRLALWGAAPGRPLSEAPGEHLYGSDVAQLRRLPGADHVLWHDPESGRAALTEAMVRHALRFEMARGVADVLARRSRLLFLDAQAAHDLAPTVAALVAEEGRRPLDMPALLAFQGLCRQYLELP